MPRLVEDVFLICERQGDMLIGKMRNEDSRLCVSYSDESILDTGNGRTGIHYLAE